MAAGADLIDDMALLRHNAMGKLFDQPYAPSMLGSFLRAFTFGHIRQLDAVASGLLTGLAERSDLLPGLDNMVLVDVDDSIVDVHGHATQGAGFGYTRVRGLNMLLATASTASAAPVILAQRLRKGACASPRGAKRLVADALETVRSLRPDDTSGPVLLRADSAFYGFPSIGAAVRAGAEVSVTVRMDPKVKAAIAAIGDDALDPDPVHRRGVRRADRAMGLPSRGRRGALHRLQQPTAQRADRRPAGRAADPGLQCLRQSR